MPNEISDFVTAMNIVEIQERDYVITFSNAYSGNAYSFQVTKVLFDKAFEKRDQFDGEMQVVNFDELENQVIDAKGMHG
jgi:hypothetical protein